MLQVTAVVELVWQDETGSTAVSLLRIPSSSTVEQADVSATALASVLVSLTDATLIGQRIRYRSAFEPTPPAFTSTPVVRAGAFYFDCTDDTPDAIITVPAITESVILTDEPMAGVGIDRQNDDVEAFVAAVIDAGCTNQFADAIVALVAAYRVSRV